MSDTEGLAALRKPFPASVIGKLPKGGATLSYVGHAAVTDRLLEVDPTWTWEPFAVTPEGLPALDRSGNLWIKLTVLGVTRIGVGDGKSAKEVIGDAIRNAAMRFGVALDLWTKDELESQHAEPAPRQEPAQRAPKETGELISDAQQRMMRVLLGKVGLTDRDEILAEVSAIIGHPIETSKDLTKAEASKVIDHLNTIANMGATA